MDPQRLAASLDRIGSSLVRGDFREVELLTNARWLSSVEVERAVVSYGRRLVTPPSGHFESRNVVEIRGSEPRRWSVCVELWTAEEGRSDLTLELTLTDSPGEPGEIYQIEIDDVHVL